MKIQVAVGIPEIGVLKVNVNNYYETLFILTQTRFKLCLHYGIPTLMTENDNSLRKSNSRVSTREPRDLCNLQAVLILIVDAVTR